MIANLYTIARTVPIFHEFRLAFVNSMTELGHTVKIFDYQNGTLKVEEPDADINFIIVERVKDIEPFLSQNQKVKNSYKVLILFEDWPNDIEQLEIRSMFNCTFDMFESLYDNYKTKLNTVYCPLGWSKEYETGLGNIKENILCYSFGAMTSTRKVFVSNHRKKIRFQLSIFGEERDRNIMRSKINVIIPAEKGFLFPPLRYLLIACKKKFILSFPYKSYIPFIPNKHLKIIKNFDSDYKYWTFSDKERHEFAEEVYKDLKTNYNYTYFLKEVLTQL